MTFTSKSQKSNDFYGVAVTFTSKSQKLNDFYGAAVTFIRVKVSSQNQPKSALPRNQRPSNAYYALPVFSFTYCIQFDASFDAIEVYH